MQKDRKKYGLIFGILGLFLCIVDIRIPTGIYYPAFESFKNQAPETVAMVIEQVRGDVWQLDLFPDLLGYISLIVSCCFFWNVKGQKKSARMIFRRPVPYLCVAFGIDLFYELIPFLLNGNYRYRLTYGIYFVALIFHTLAVFEYAMCFGHASENVHNHQDNNVTIIIMMFGFLAMVIKEVVWFYQILWGAAIYYAVALILLEIAAGRFYRERSYMVLDAEVTEG